MMNQQPFPIAPKTLLAAISSYLYSDGQELGAKIIDSSCAEIIQTEYDNWNGGTYSYCLHIHISREDFIKVGFDSIQTLQNIICEKLNIFSKPYPNHHISSVSITPTITAESHQSQNAYLQEDDVSELILNFIALSEKRTPGVYVEDTTIAQELGIEIQDVQDWIDILEGDGRITTANSFAGFSALLTAKGRLFHKRSHHSLQVKTTSINTHGGASIGGNANAGGDIAGRDIIYNVYQTTEPVVSDKGKKPLASQADILWLTRISEKLQFGEEVNRRSLLVELHNQLPELFNPEEIDSRLCVNGIKPTLLGLTLVNPNLTIVRHAEIVALAIKDILIKTPAKREITTSDVSQKVHLREGEIAFQFENMAGFNSAGYFHNAGENYIGQDGRGWGKIIVTEDVFDRYLKFKNMPDLLNRLRASDSYKWF